MATGLLIGKKLNLMVSEPWGFGTEHGCGPFEVVVQGESPTALFLKLAKPLQFEGATWTFLATTPRHKGVEIKTLLQRSKVDINVILVEESAAKSDPESFGSESNGVRLILPTNGGHLNEGSIHCFKV
jgi:hypothetical protein